MTQAHVVSKAHFQDVPSEAREPVQRQVISLYTYIQRERERARATAQAAPARAAAGIAAASSRNPPPPAGRAVRRAARRRAASAGESNQGGGGGNAGLLLQARPVPGRPSQPAPGVSRPPPPAATARSRTESRAGPGRAGGRAVRAGRGAVWRARAMRLPGTGRGGGVGGG